MPPKAKGHCRSCASFRLAGLALVAAGLVALAPAASAQPQGAGCRGGSTSKGRMTAYISPKSSREFRDLARYRLSNGCPAINVAIIFAGNYAASERPYLRANNNDPPTTKPFNDSLQQVLVDGSVRYLQARGIKVLLSILNGHSPVGWSEFTSEDAARDFAQYLKTDVVARYGLDGIDIDDEYSSGVPNDTSLIMVTTLMRRLMPNKLITKALWQDRRYFRSAWRGHTLARNLAFGAQMAYGGPPRPRLRPYTRWLSKGQLSLGFWSGQPSRTPAKDVKWARDSGYAGAMVYGFEEKSNVDLMGKLVNAWYGPGNWNKVARAPGFALVPVESDLAEARAGRLTVAAGCGSACRVVAELRAADRPLLLGRGVARFAGRGTKAIRVKLTAAGRRALRGVARLKAKLRLRGKGAGAPPSWERSLMLRRMDVARVARRGLTFAARCSASCSIAANLVMGPHEARRLGLRAPGGEAVAVAGSTGLASTRSSRFVLRPRKSTRRALLRARRTKVTLRATVGLTQRVSYPLTLHR
jgi:hypothetical protein